jgi:hypothetical protein
VANAVMATSWVIRNINSATTNPQSNDAGISEVMYGVVDSFKEVRGAAWANRDLQYAALLYPQDPSGTTGNPVFSDGSNTAQYLNDIADASADFPWIQFNEAAVYNAWAKNAGIWMMYTKNIYPAGSDGYTNGIFSLGGFTFWQTCFLGLSMCIAAARGNANALQYLQNILAKQLSYISTATKGNAPNGYWNIFNEGAALVTVLPFLPGSQLTLPEYITSDDELAMSQQGSLWYTGGPSGAPWVTWAPNYSGSTYLGPAFTFNQFPIGWSGVTLANGDKYICNWNPGTSNDYGRIVTPSELTAGTPYWAINGQQVGSNFSFDLCAAKPGQSGDNVPVVITDTTPTGSGMSFGMIFVNPGEPPTAPYGLDYVFIPWQVACWASAHGYADFGSTSDLNSTLGCAWDYINGTAGGWPPNTRGTQPGPPAGETNDARYATQSALGGPGDFPP